MIEQPHIRTVASRSPPAKWSVGSRSALAGCCRTWTSRTKLRINTD